MKYEITICTECLMATANGVTEEQGAEFAERYAKAVQLEGQEPSLGDDREGHFSWSPCSFCRDNLGGQRYEAYLIPTPKEVYELGLKSGL